jgi:glucans biosynthesis protein C
MLTGHSRMSITLSNPATVGAKGETQRLIFVDVLRVLVIVFVIVHHAAQAYGPTGGAWPVHDQAHSDWFRPFYTVNSAFGLGLLFLLAGYFVPGSCGRKGARRFLKERWARIGVPLVTLALFVHLPAAYLFKSRPALGGFIGWLYGSGWQPIYLHLWFLWHLLLYSVVYVAWREVVARSRQVPSSWRPPDHTAIVGFVAALAFITWIFRVRYPVDKWVPLLWVVPAEPAHLPQYVMLFAAGVAAYRGNWLRGTPTSVGMTWLSVGIIASAGVYVAHRSAYGIRLWELATHLVIARTQHLGDDNLCEPVRWADRPVPAMAAASFAAYILHLAIVIAAQATIEGLALPAIIKFALVAVSATILAFVLAHLSGNVPGLRTVLGTSGAGNTVSADYSASERAR